MSPLTAASTKPPPWRDIRVLRWLFQLVVLAIVLGILFWLYSNYQVNISKSKIPTDLRFLSNPANFTFPGQEFDQSAPVRAAFVQGFYNTLRVAIAGIILAIALGTLVGMARLSKNFLVRAVATAYVEVIRNIPLLLLLTFMNLAVVLQTFPRIEDAWKPLDLFVISNRGIAIPWFDGSTQTLLIVFGVGLIAAIVAGWLRTRSSDRTGRPARSLTYSLLAFILVTVGAWMALGYTWTLPVVADRGTEGGLRLDPSFFALLVTLVVYTSSHIAEIVRGSILAVPKGQGEAADALALSHGTKMRLVI